MQARTANEVLKAQERRLRLQQLKGELVDRAKAVAQVFRLARDERDAWINWPARVAAMIAAELELDPHALHTVLERHIRDHLADLAEVRRACADGHQQELGFMLRALRHPLLVGTAEVLADAVRYVAIMLFVLLLLRQLARVAL
jgi:hypothetical protein